MHKYEINQALCACYDGKLRRRVQAVLSQRQISHHEDVSAFVTTIFPPFPIFTRKHGNQLTSRPTVTHMHRGAWWYTLSALKVIREEYVIISVENCVKPWQNNLKASCETAKCPKFHVTQMQLIPVTEVQPGVVYCITLVFTLNLWRDKQDATLSNEMNLLRVLVSPTQLVVLIMFIFQISR